MANPVKAWRTVDAGPAQPLHQMVQPSLVLPLAHAAAHRDEALALVSADALVRRLCDGPDGVREDVPRVDPAPAAGSTAASLRGAPLLPTEWVLARHATSMSVKNRVLRLLKPRVPGSQSLEYLRKSKNTDARPCPAGPNPGPGMAPATRTRRWNTRCGHFASPRRNRSASIPVTVYPACVVLVFPCLTPSRR